MRPLIFRLASIFALGLSQTLASYSQAPSDQLQSLFKQGAEAMHAGNASAAEAAFAKAVEVDPSFAPAHLDLGLVQLKQGEVLKAVASIKKSLELDPASPGAHLFLGIAEYQSNQYDEALGDLRKAIQAEPQNVQALTWLGIVQLNAGHPELAVEPLDQAAQLAPTDENVLDYRVQAHMAAAKQSYAVLFKLDPSSWRLHRLNAAIDADAQDHTHAIEEYQEAIKLAPDQPELYEGMGWEYRKLGHADLAVKAFAEQVRLTPGNPIAMYNLGSAQVDSGQEKAAIPLLQQVVTIYNHPTGADYYLGRALVVDGKDAEAAKYFQRATTLEGEMQMRAWYELSQTYRRMGETTEARAAVLHYEELKRASEAATAKSTEDWRKLSAANAASASQK